MSICILFHTSFAYCSFHIGKDLLRTQLTLPATRPSEGTKNGFSVGQDPGPQHTSSSLWPPGTRLGKLSTTTSPGLKAGQKGQKGLSEFQKAPCLMNKTKQNKKKSVLLTTCQASGGLLFSWPLSYPATPTPGSCLPRPCSSCLFLPGHRVFSDLPPGLLTSGLAPGVYFCSASTCLMCRSTHNKLCPGLSLLALSVGQLSLVGLRKLQMCFVMAQGSPSREQPAAPPP